jgi:hypothetical protein
VKLLGTVVEILSGTLLLVKANEGTASDFNIDEILKVFGQIENESLQRKYDLSNIYVPKGEIRIVTHQSSHYYLAETFRELIDSPRSIEKPSSLLTGIWGAQVVREKVLGPPSAVLAPATEPIEVSKKVVVGDLVGKD